MLKVVKINTDNFQAVSTAFLQNFGVQTNNRIVITDFNSMKQMKDETVQQFFTRIGDIAYNYDLKKPTEAIKGDVWEAPEEHEETLAGFMALPLAVHRLVLQLDYQQIARNNISFLGLQFFVAGLHSNNSLEVIKSGTTDMYAAFLIAHAYETAAKDKKKNRQWVKSTQNQRDGRRVQRGRRSSNPSHQT